MTNELYELLNAQAKVNDVVERRINFLENSAQETLNIIKKCVEVIERDGKNIIGLIGTVKNLQSEVSYLRNCVASLQKGA
jgi:hypothetical protein